jgi:peptidoglycan L-alanyl-D-glutamate endopeptidase CwlK
VDFAVVEGKRTRDRQAELVRIGASKTMFSRHITGHAVDLAPIVGGTICWKWPAFTPLVDAMKRASQEMGIMLVHGADWKSFPDGPHHELDRRYFP